MSPVRIPEPTRSTSEQIARLDRAIGLFADAKERRETAQKAVTAAKFALGDLQRNAPRAFSDIRAQAQHERGLKDAQAAIDEATEIFLNLDREVGQAAGDVQELHRDLCAAARLELEPVQRGAMREVETALDALLAAIEVACAVNRIIGTGSPDCYPRVPSPMSLNHDLAYRRPRAEPEVAAEWLKLRKLRSGAMDAGSETPLQAAEQGPRRAGPSLPQMVVRPVTPPPVLPAVSKGVRARRRRLPPENLRSVKN